jgi:hypothetical protein
LDEGEGKQDILLVTVGGAYRMDRVRSGFSVFHRWSNAGFEAFNVPNGTARMRSRVYGTARMRSRVYGASLVFSYALGDAAPSATPPTSSPAPVL